MARLTKYHKTKRPKPQNFFFSQLWRLDAPTSGFWGGLPSWPAVGYLLAMYSYDSLSSVCARGGRERESTSELFGVSSYKDTSPMGSRPHPITSFVLNYFLRDPVPKYSHTGGYSFSMWILRDTTIESITGGIYVMVGGLMTYNYIIFAISTASNSESLPMYLDLFIPTIITKFIGKRIKFILAYVSVLHKICWWGSYTFLH